MESLRIKNYEFINGRTVITSQCPICHYEETLTPEKALELPLEYKCYCCQNELSISGFRYNVTQIKNEVGFRVGFLKALGLMERDTTEEEYIQDCSSANINDTFRGLE